MKQDNELQWIAVDWGTTHLRVFAMSKENHVTDQRFSDKGMGVLSKNQFEPELISLISDWSHGSSRMQVLACGMVGAKQGWVEAPYAETPCPPLTGSGLINVPLSDSKYSMHIVPGVCQRNPADVMRGEETLIAGLIDQTPENCNCVCLPGTHSKWVSIEQGEIQHFASFMTGELFSLLSQQSVLRHGVSNEGMDKAVFLQGLEHATLQPEQWMSDLFRIRAQGLLNNLEQVHARSLLSGQLIGAELIGAKHYWQNNTVSLIGDHRLTELYIDALNFLGIEAHSYDPQIMLINGLSTIYRTITKN